VPSRTMLARQAAFLTPKDLPIPDGYFLANTLLTQTFSCNTYASPRKCCKQRLTVELSPLAATLTKTGWGQRERFSTYCAFNPTSHLPYALPSSVSLKSFASRSTKTVGCGDLFPFRNSSLAPSDHQSQQFPNSLRKTRGWGHFVD